MGQHTANEVAACLAHTATSLGVKQQIRACMGCMRGPPEAAMDMRTTASLIQEWLGSKRGDDVVLEGHTAHGLTHQQRVICSARASAWWIESSCWPGPSSGINCST